MPEHIWKAPVSNWCTYYMQLLADEVLLAEALFLEVSLLHQWRQLLIFLCFPLPLHFIIGLCDLNRCPSLVIIRPSCDEASLPCLESTPCIMWDCRSVFLLEKAWSLIFCHIEPIQHREMTERVGCTSCVVEDGVGVRNISR